MKTGTYGRGGSFLGLGREGFRGDFQKSVMKREKKNPSLQRGGVVVTTVVGRRRFFI